MATVVGECAAVLCRLLKAVQANEDPIGLFRTLERVFRALKVTATVCFHRLVRVKEVVVLRVVYLVILPKIKEIPNYILYYIYKGFTFCAFSVSR
jgi:hypothetical protein